MLPINHCCQQSIFSIVHFPLLSLLFLFVGGKVGNFILWVIFVKMWKQFDTQQHDHCSAGCFHLGLGLILFQVPTPEVNPPHSCFRKFRASQPYPTGSFVTSMHLKIWLKRTRMYQKHQNSKNYRRREGKLQ